VTIDTSIIVAVVSAAALVIGTTITALVTRRSHQDTALRTDIDRLRAEVAAARAETAQVRRENRVLADYVHQLRALLDEAGEDVPPWPDGLTT